VVGVPLFGFCASCFGLLRHGWAGVGCLGLFSFLGLRWLLFCAVASVVWGLWCGVGVVGWALLESLILAQDERWRRA
jgi:hypothetical protein